MLKVRSGYEGGASARSLGSIYLKEVADLLPVSPEEERSLIVDTSHVGMAVPPQCFGEGSGHRALYVHAQCGIEGMK